MECSVSECDRETSTMKMPWPIRGCRAMKKKSVFVLREVLKHTGQKTKCTRKYLIREE